MSEHNAPARIKWEERTQETFQKILMDIPDMIRGVAEARVSKKATHLAHENNRPEISEKELVDALFAETPGGFIPIMKESLEKNQVDYKKYGHLA